LLSNRDDERPVHLDPFIPAKWSSDTMDKAVAERHPLGGSARVASEDFSIILQHETTSPNRLNFAPWALGRRLYTHIVEVDEEVRTVGNKTDGMSEH
jgi:hypothetical protein